LAEKLLPGALLRAFDRTSTPQALSRYLERSLRNWLRDKARTRSWPRLLLRSRQILEHGTGQFAGFDDETNWIERHWGLAGWLKPQPAQGKRNSSLRYRNIEQVGARMATMPVHPEG
jgi:hypothetical protein